MRVFLVSVVLSRWRFLAKLTPHPKIQTLPALEPIWTTLRIAFTCTPMIRPHLFDSTNVLSSAPL